MSVWRLLEVFFRPCWVMRSNTVTLSAALQVNSKHIFHLPPLPVPTALPPLYLIFIFSPLLLFIYLFIFSFNHPFFSIFFYSSFALSVSLLSLLSVLHCFVLMMDCCVWTENEMLCVDIHSVWLNVCITCCAHSVMLKGISESSCSILKHTHTAPSPLACPYCGQ